jgi:hypothetical protein
LAPAAYIQCNVAAYTQCIVEGVYFVQLVELPEDPAISTWRKSPFSGSKLHDHYNNIR